MNKAFDNYLLKLSPALDVTILQATAAPLS